MSTVVQLESTIGPTEQWELTAVVAASMAIKADSRVVDAGMRSVGTDCFGQSGG